MNKAYVQLSNDILLDTIIPVDTKSDIMTICRKDYLLRYIIYALILGIVIAFFIYIWKYSSEPFDMDAPSDRDSFPARIDSNKTIRQTGKCNTSHKTIRSIIKGNNRRTGDSRHQEYTNIEKEKRRRRVRWRDPLVMVMNI